MTKTRNAEPSRQCGADYYERLHGKSAKYQKNNWLLDRLALLAEVGGESIMEVGCGNGRFLQGASRYWNDVVGVDWVRSPVLDQILQANPQIRFAQEDVTELTDMGRFDLVVSADVLEHLSPAALPAVIKRLHECGRRNYHRIACYDDGHSHLSVFGPQEWLRLFEDAVPDGGYRILERAYRKQRRKKLVVVVSNIAPPTA